MPRRDRPSRVAVPVLLLVAVLVGYVVADVADVLPGPLTASAPAGDRQPWPTASLPGEPAADPVPGPDPQAPTPAADDLGALTGTLLADPATSSSGVVVVDALEGTELLAADAGTARPPASTLKLLAATAALATAGPEHRFVTRVVEGGEASDGGVVLVAGGDLTLAAGAGDPDAVMGRGGLGDLAAATAAALAEQGRTEVGLGLDESLWTGPVLAPRWDEIDLATGDAMPMSPIAVDAGLVEGSQRREADPGLAAAQAFAAALEAEGVQVTGDVTRLTADPGAAELAQVRSAPLADVVAHTLQVSENILSESIGRLVALEAGEEPSFAGAGDAVRTVLADLGVDVTGLDLVETSGLSSLNQVAPATLTGTLHLVATSPALSAVARGLPVGALEGTLSDRLGGTDAAGTVAAKTGTLRGVVSLSGFVTTADGRLLAFAVIADGVPTGATAAARDAVDAWVSGVASCGCT